MTHIGVRIQTRTIQHDLRTCSDDVEYTGHSLLTDPVRGVAQESAVIQFRHGSVGHDAGRPRAGDVRRRHVHAVRRVVEHPSELHVGGIGVHLAFDFRLFLLGDTVHPHLVRFARRGDCTK